MPRGGLPPPYMHPKVDPLRKTLGSALTLTLPPESLTLLPISPISLPRTPPWRLYYVGACRVPPFPLVQPHAIDDMHVLWQYYMVIVSFCVCIVIVLRDPGPMWFAPRCPYLAVRGASGSSTCSAPFRVIFLMCPSNVRIHSCFYLTFVLSLSCCFCLLLLVLLHYCFLLYHLFALSLCVDPLWLHGA